jgi:hypothetical protein
MSTACFLPGTSWSTGFNWVAVARWPELAARLRACERIVAESPDRAERREAAAEISQILRQAETITA